MTDPGQPLRLDPEARSQDPAQPAFLSRPPGAPPYHGFPLVVETSTDGWVYGAITEFEASAGTTGGDGYVQAPDGRRAGLVWQVGTGEFSQILAPDPERWGVYSVWFPKPVRSLADLTECFRHVLPDLKRVYAALFAGPDA